MNPRPCGTVWAGGLGFGLIPLGSLPPPDMGQPLRVLLVEDSGDDAALIVRALRRGGYEPVFERVETPEAFVEALGRGGGWDLVLSDYSLPRLDALEVLDLLQEHAPRLPCIVLSGNIGEETAVATMRAGAADYLMKSNLARLLPTVERELRGAGERRERVEAKRALLDLQEQFGVIFREFADVMIIARAGGETAAGGPGARCCTPTRRWTACWGSPPGTWSAVPWNHSGPSRAAGTCTT